MTRNLSNVAGLGHFLLVIGPQSRMNACEHTLRTLQPSIPDGKMPPSLNRISDHAIAAGWGGFSIDHDETDTVVGCFQRARHDGPALNGARVRAAYRAANGGVIDARALAGSNFAAVVIDNKAPRALGVTAPFRQLPLYVAARDDMAAFATDARLLIASGLIPADIDPEAVYHYLNFSCVPAPHSIFRNVRKVPAGRQVHATPGTLREVRYWRPRFDGNVDGERDALSASLHERIDATVRAYRPVDGTKWGAFLSGGTDSSSITGILAASMPGTPVRTFSIGFAEEGYDELEYARIAAQHYGARAHERTVSEQDTLDAIPHLIEAYDEPYGNASAVPTYYCAAMAAAEGVQVMIAGDGGDENFGGNERYARNNIYDMYARLPAPLRRAAAALAGEPSASASLFVNRVRNFLRRGALPNPERFYREESFASEHFDALLSPRLREQLAPQLSLDVVRRHYDDAGDIDELHRLMYIDLMMAIADNDLTKVQRAGQAAGVSVSYPYLDPELVEYTGRLRASWKVKGLRKRYLFKEAMRGVLPEAILTKRKQGFGLPIAHWMRKPGGLRELVHDTLRSRRALERGWFEQGFVERLIARHERGGWDLSPELWRLTMFELWQKECVDGA